MRKWILVAATVALLALSGGVALASWGGGTGSDAVSVEGTVRLVDTKYWIDGDLTPLCDPNIVCNVTAVEDGSWLLDFGAANYYLSNPGSCDLSGFPAPQHTIDGKLSQHGEIDVYRVDGCDLRSGEEGGSPPWSAGDDSDSDGFEDLVEAYVGTDPVDGCPDDPTDDAWPPDWDNNQTANLLDVLPLKPHFNAASAADPRYDPRFDLDTDGAVNMLDLLPFKPFFNLSCA